MLSTQQAGAGGLLLLDPPPPLAAPSPGSLGHGAPRQKMSPRVSVACPVGNRDSTSASPGNSLSHKAHSPSDASLPSVRPLPSPRSSEGRKSAFLPWEPLREGPAPQASQHLATTAGSSGSADPRQGSRGSAPRGLLTCPLPSLHCPFPAGVWVSPLPVVRVAPPSAGG